MDLRWSTTACVILVSLEVIFSIHIASKQILLFARMYKPCPAALVEMFYLYMLIRPACHRLLYGRAFKLTLSHQDLCQSLTGLLHSWSIRPFSLRKPCLDLSSWRNAPDIKSEIMASLQKLWSETRAQVSRIRYIRLKPLSSLLGPKCDNDLFNAFLNLCLREASWERTCRFT